MRFKFLDEKTVAPYLSQTNLIAYTDQFAAFAKTTYQSERFFVGVMGNNDELGAFFPVFQREERRQKIAEVPLFIYTEIFFVDKNFTISGLELGQELRKFLKDDVLRLNLYQLEANNLQTAGLDHIFTAMITSLSGLTSYDDFLKKVLSKNARSKIYKSYTVGLERINLTLADLPEFHQLYSAHAQNLGSRPHSLEYFQKMINAYHWGEDLFILGARYQGKLVAANLFVVNKKYIEVRFLADDNQWRHLFPNNFLYAEMIKWAIGRGVQYVDFGGINKAARSNIEFKMSLGAKEYPIFTKYFFRSPWQKLKFKIQKKKLYWKKYRKLILKNWV